MIRETALGVRPSRSVRIANVALPPMVYVLSSTQMRRCLLQLTVLLAMISVGANAVCSTKCIVASCDLAPQTGSPADDDDCHHHGTPSAPTHGGQECAHPQLFANDSLRTVVPINSADVAFEAVVVRFSPIGIELASSPLVALFEVSPPSLPDLLSTTVLRV